MAKVRQEKHNETAERLEEKKAEFKQYLIKQNWTEADMLNHEWIDRDGVHTLGHIENYYIRNSNGICIYPSGLVQIGWFDRNSRSVANYIRCNPTFGFKIIKK